MVGERGREKVVTSPDGDARKKKGSLFRRASLSRRKNKEEIRTRSKSKDRYAENSQSSNTLSDDRESAEKKKAKSSSLPRDLKSPFGRPKHEKSKNKDLARRRTLDLENTVPIRTLADCVKRSGCYNLEIPEIIKALICDIESRGLQTMQIYQKSAPKAEVREIIRAFDQLEEIDLTEATVHSICNALKEFVSSLPENIVEGIKDQLEESILKPETFIETGEKLLETIPKQNFALSSWIFTHLNNVMSNYEENKLTDDILSRTWAQVLNLSPHLVTGMTKNAVAFFGELKLEKGRVILRWKDSSLDLKIPDNATEEWMKEEINLQETILSKLHTYMQEKQDEYSDHRLWEVQRILTALKRKKRNMLKVKNENEKKKQEEMEKLLEEEAYAMIEQEELLKMQQELRDRLEEEKQKVQILRTKLPTVETGKVEPDDGATEEELNTILDDLLKENARLETENSTLVDSISSEREALLRARINCRIK